LIFFKICLDCGQYPILWLDNTHHIPVISCSALLFFFPEDGFRELCAFVFRERVITKGYFCRSKSKRRKKGNCLSYLNQSYLTPVRLSMSYMLSEPRFIFLYTIFCVLFFPIYSKLSKYSILSFFREGL
jgi:hypothetical protein